MKKLFTLLIALLFWANYSWGQNIFFEGFETGNTQATAITGWTQVSVVGSGVWNANTSLTSYNRTPRTGSWNSYLAYSNTDWMFKQVTLTSGTNYVLSFYARQDVSSGCNIQAKYGAAASVAGMTDQIIASSAVISGNYQYFSGTFTPATSGTFYIGIRADLTSSPWYISIDDISLDVVAAVPPNCAVNVSPSDLSTGVPITGTLNWSNGGGGTTGYKLFLGTDNPPTNLLNGTDLGNVLTYNPTPDLNYGTTYYWKVVPYNVYGDATGCSVWSFTTGPDPTVTTYPYTTGFEETTFPPYGWTQITVSGTNVWTRSTSSPHGGTYSAIAPWATVGGEHLLITAPLNLTDKNYRLKFWLKGSSSAGTDLDVQIATSNSSAANFTTNLASYVAGTNMPTVWTEQVIDLSTYENIQYIAFRMSDLDGYSLYIDDVTIEEIPLTTFDWNNLQFPASANIVADQNVTVYARCYEPGVTEAAGAGAGVESWIGYSTSDTDPSTWTNWVPAVYNVDAGNNDEYKADLGVLQGLTPGTYYYASRFRLTAGPYTYGGYNAGGGGTWGGANVSGILTITPVTIATFPHTQNFDGVTSPALPAGWGKVVSSTSIYAVVQNSTTGPNSSPNNAYLYNSDDLTADLRLVSPTIVPSLNGARVKFFARGGTGFTVQVGTMDSPTGTFTLRETITITGTNAQYNVSFAGYAGTDTYLAFKHGVGGTYRSVYIDDIVMEVIQAIPPETASIVFPLDALTTLNNPLLKWTPSVNGEPATGFKVLMDGTNPPTTEVYNGTATSFQTAGLVAGNTYYWKVVPYNTNGDATGAATWSFTVVPADYLAESFESTTFPPAGWANPGTWSRSTSYYFPGVASAYKYTSVTENLLRTPLVTITGSSTLKFFARTSTANADQRLQVQYSADGTTWTDIGAEISLPSAGAFAQYSIDLSSLAGNNYYLAIAAYYVGTSAGSVYVDHIIGPMITPLLPDAVTLVSPADLATNVPGLVTLSWTAASTGGIPTGYKVFLDKTDGSSEAGTVTTTSFTTLLNYSETYYWKIAAYNAAGEGPASVVRSFITEADPTLTPPVTQPFDTYLPANWQEKSGILANPSVLTGTTSNWGADGFGNIGTTGAAGINIYGTTRKDWLISPPINLGDGSVDYQLRFDLALTKWNATTAPDLTGTDDKFAVVISTDNGLTWSSANTLRLWDNAGSVYVYNSITLTGELVTIDLSAYSGIVRFGFYGESTISNADNDLFVDNFKVQLPPTYGNVSGILSDCYTSGVLSGATVTMGALSTTTDALGYYEFLNVETGTYSITTSLAGYVTKTTTGVVISTGLTTTQNICMSIVVDPPVNLQGSVAFQDVNLTWQVPGSMPPDQWIKWDDGVNDNAIGLTGGGTFSVASRWPVTDIDPYDGMYLRTIRFYAADLTATYTLKVWSGINAATELHSQAVTPVLGWNEITLSTAILIDGTQEFWFGYETTHADLVYPAGCDDGPNIEGKGNMLYDGATWASLYSLAPTLTGNWNLAGFVSATSAKGPNQNMVMMQYNQSVQSIPTIQSLQPERGASQVMLSSARANAEITGVPYVSLPANQEITLNPGENDGSMAASATLTGYNVYRDNVEIVHNTTNLYYNDLALPAGTYSYTVSALYVEAESAKIGPVVLSVVTCSAPEDLSVVDVTPTTAKLAWVETGTATTWDIEFGDYNFIPTGTPTNAGVTANPFPVSGLISGNLYTFYVRAACGGAAGSSDWVGPFSFATECELYTVPYSTDFSSVNCWTVDYSGTGVTNRWAINNGATMYAGGTVPEMVCQFQDATGISRFISPEINTAGMTQLKVTFRQMFNDWGTEAEHCTIKLRSSTDGISWTDEGFTWTSGMGDIAATTTEVIVLNNLGTSTYIAWEVDGYLYDFDYWYIDDVSFEAVAPVTKTIDVTVFLEGPYGTGPAMTTVLNPAQLPLSQPYTGVPWNYAGTESVTSIPAGVVDWVLVDLRDAATAAAAIPATSLSGPKAFFLKSDGKIVALDGTSLPDIGNPTITNNLFVVVRHRNHIAVMSANGMTLAGSTYSYDFSIDVTQAYNGSTGYKLIATGVYGMVTGDADADGSVFPSDYNQWASKYNTAGYLNSDFDMDVNVYPSDYNKWAANYNKGNPISKNVQPFVYRSQVPGDIK